MPTIHGILFGDYTYPAHIEALAEMQHGDNVFGVPFTGEVSLEGSMKQARSILDALRDRSGDRRVHTPGDVRSDGAPRRYRGGGRARPSMRPYCDGHG